MSQVSNFFSSAHVAEEKPGEKLVHCFIVKDDNAINVGVMIARDLTLSEPGFFTCEKPGVGWFVFFICRL